MSRKKRIRNMALIGLLCILGLYLLGAVRLAFNPEEQQNNGGNYESLPKDVSLEDPLKNINEVFQVTEEFHTNLPIVVLTIDGEVSDYKWFQDGQEQVTKSEEPYTTGTIQIIDEGDSDNYLNDQPSYKSDLELKKRGHTSFSYDKPQYLLKMSNSDGTENKTEILGMGEGDEWILNGSMADKSMIRNYLAYRIASEIGGGKMAPDSRFCEVIVKEGESYRYQGVYLLQEAIARGESRIAIDKYREKKAYSSYIVRRDRFTNFDPMLNTYGRTSGKSKEWIGVKFPSEGKLTEETKQYIAKDFSRIEQVLYSSEEAEYKAYDRYIEVDSFVDYFLINEFFGNYDAGEHSTYMYKNTGEKLWIGPVWDFDQAMNNYFQDEMKPNTLAFQTKPFFAELSKDRRFIDLLKERYAELRKTSLSEEHVIEVMTEAVDYLKSAREREWYRWAENYQDSSFNNPGSYYLQDYVKNGLIIRRSNDDYDQEIYNIKTYLHKHGRAIQGELTKLYELSKFNTSIKNENELLLLVIMSLFLVPSILINRRV